MMNHQFAVSGGTQRVNYMLSLGYYTQDGIVGGNFGRSNYERMTMRSNIGITLFDESAKRSWLNKATINTNIAYTRIKTKTSKPTLPGVRPSARPCRCRPCSSFPRKGSAEEASQLAYLSGQATMYPCTAPTDVS